MKITVTFLFILGFYLFSTVKLQPVEPIPAADSPQGAVQIENQEGICECAVFGVEILTPDDKPILTKPTIDVQCNGEGKKLCADICRLLARSARENAGGTLCSTLGDAEKVQPSIFAKVCDEGGYTFTGLTSPKSYCCQSGEPFVCE